jgi:hypothetical protein
MEKVMIAAVTVSFLLIAVVMGIAFGVFDR